MDIKERKRLLAEFLDEQQLNKLAQETVTPTTTDPQAGEQFAEKVYDKFIADILAELDQDLSGS